MKLLAIWSGTGAWSPVSSLVTADWSPIIGNWRPLTRERQTVTAVRWPALGHW